MNVHLFDFRDRIKPAYGRAPSGGSRPHFSESLTLARRRAQARAAGGIERIVLHHWGAHVRLGRLALRLVAEADTYDDKRVMAARQLAYRAAGLDPYGAAPAIGGTPYHVSCGATAYGDGVVVLVWQREVHTFHAERENAASIGVGVMARLDQHEEGPARPAMAAALVEALCQAALMVRPDGRRPVELRTHSQTQRKPADPGLWAIKHGVSPLVLTGELAVDPDYCDGNGRPWPQSWREVLRG